MDLICGIGYASLMPENVLSSHHQKIADFWVAAFAQDGVLNNTDIAEAPKEEGFLQLSKRGQDFLKLLGDGRVDEKELQRIEEAEGKASDFYKIAERIGARPRLTRLENLKEILSSGSTPIPEGRNVLWSDLTQLKAALTELPWYGEETEALAKELLQTTQNENASIRKQAAQVLGMVASHWDLSLRVVARETLEKLANDSIQEVKDSALVAQQQVEDVNIACFTGDQKEHLIKKLHELNEKVDEARKAASTDIEVFTVKIKEAIAMKKNIAGMFPDIYVSPDNAGLSFLLVYNLMYTIDRIWENFQNILPEYTPDKAKTIKGLIDALEAEIRNLQKLFEKPWGKGGTTIGALEKLKQKLEEMLNLAQQCLKNGKCQSLPTFRPLYSFKKAFFDSLFSPFDLIAVYFNLYIMDGRLELVFSSKDAELLGGFEKTKQLLLDEVKKTKTCEKPKKKKWL